MRVCVVGLWHLGSVTAACLASRGHQVVGFDESAETVAGLAQGVPPLFEPGLAELTAAGIAGNAAVNSQVVRLQIDEVGCSHGTGNFRALCRFQVDFVRSAKSHIAPGSPRSQLTAGHDVDVDTSDQQLIGG